MQTVEASIQYLEAVDISSTDHTVAEGNGVGRCVICDTAGEIIKFDSTKQTGMTTVALQAGITPLEVVKVYKTGSTISGNVQVGGWD